MMIINKGLSFPCVEFSHRSYLCFYVSVAMHQIDRHEGLTALVAVSLVDTVDP